MFVTSPFYSSNESEALFLAMIAHDYPYVNRLIANGLGVNKTFDAWKWTTLHHVAKEGDEYVVMQLILGGADIDAEDWEGQTPLHLAAFYGHVGVVQLLLDARASVFHIDRYGMTAEMLAFKHDKTMTAALIAQQRKRQTRWSAARMAWLTSIIVL
jgi:ankyrin repeat protein